MGVCLQLRWLPPNFSGLKNLAPYPKPPSLHFLDWSYYNSKATPECWELLLLTKTRFLVHVVHYRARYPVSVHFVSECNTSWFYCLVGLGILVVC